jgi:hypothetical protein
MRSLSVLFASWLVALGGATGAMAHGDPPLHYLETESLYPAFASRPSQALELELLGLLQASEQRGYPIKVALVGNRRDLSENPSMLREPQLYAESLSSRLEALGRLVGPVLVVSPYGVGVSGRQLRGGRLRPRAEVQPDAQGNELVGAAMDAVRRIARAGGHPLPEQVPAAETIGTGVPEGQGSNGGADAKGGAELWRWAVPVAAFVLTLVLFEVWIKVSRRRRESALGREPSTGG